MKKSNFLSGLLVVLFLVAVGTNKGFCQVQRQVNQSTLKKTTCAIPAYVDDSELSGLDWIYLERDDKEECMEHTIKGDTLTIVRYNPQKPRWENDYEYQMGKSVTSVWGTALYYHDGTEYYRLESYNPEFILSSKDIENYGIYNTVFDMDREELINQFQTAGFQVSEQDGFIIATIGDFVEISINLDELIYQLRFFGDEDNPFFEEEGNKIEHSTRTEYAKINAYVIPIRDIDVRYSELPSGIPYEITDTVSYLFYQVIKNGNTIVKTGEENIFEDCRNSVADNTNIKEIQQANVKVYPNPAKERITLDLPFDGNGNVDVQIFNVLGVNVLSQQAKGEQINIDVQALPAGVYVLKIQTDKEIITKKVVKQ